MANNNRTPKSPARGGVTYFNQFPKNFLKPYGKQEEVPNVSKVFDRIKPFSCEWLARPKVALSEMIDTVKECLTTLDEGHSPIIDSEGIKPFKNLCTQLQSSFGNFNTKYYTTSGTKEQLRQGIGDIFQMDDAVVDQIYTISSTLFVTSIQLIVGRTILRNPHIYATKVACLEGKDNQFQRDRNIQQMFNYLSDCIVTSQVNSTDNRDGRLANYHALMNLTTTDGSDNNTDNNLLSVSSQVPLASSIATPLFSEHCTSAQSACSPSVEHKEPKPDNQSGLLDTTEEDYKQAVRLIQSMKKTGIYQELMPMKRVILEKDTSDEEIHSEGDQLSQATLKRKRRVAFKDNDKENATAPKKVKFAANVPDGNNKCPQHDSQHQNKDSPLQKKISPGKFSKPVQPSSSDSDDSDTDSSDSSTKQQKSTATLQTASTTLEKPARPSASALKKKGTETPTTKKPSVPERIPVATTTSSKKTGATSSSDSSDSDFSDSREDQKKSTSAQAVKSLRKTGEKQQRPATSPKPSKPKK